MSLYATAPDTLAASLGCFGSEGHMTMIYDNVVNNSLVGVRGFGAGDLAESLSRRDVRVTVALGWRARSAIQ